MVVGPAGPRRRARRPRAGHGRRRAGVGRRLLGGVEGRRSRRARAIQRDRDRVHQAEGAAGEVVGRGAGTGAWRPPGRSSRRGGNPGRTGSCSRRPAAGQPEHHLEVLGNPQLAAVQHEERRGVAGQRHAERGPPKQATVSLRDRQVERLRVETETGEARKREQDQAGPFAGGGARAFPQPHPPYRRVSSPCRAGHASPLLATERALGRQARRNRQIRRDFRRACRAQRRVERAVAASRSRCPGPMRPRPAPEAVAKLERAPAT